MSQRNSVYDLTDARLDIQTHTGATPCTIFIQGSNNKKQGCHRLPTLYRYIDHVSINEVAIYRKKQRRQGNLQCNCQAELLLLAF